MSYLYELHFHTPETSPCCKVAPGLVLPLYAENGYTGVVITDHYGPEWFESQPETDWASKINRWLAGYRIATQEGTKCNLQIYLGMELQLSGSGNEYLVYGIDEDFLYRFPELYNLTPSEFRDLTERHGLFVAQAHPFRKYCSPACPAWLDGIEIYNGNPRHASRNELAEAYAAQNRLTGLSGSDFHQMEDACRGGTYLTEPPNNPHEIAALLFQDGIERLRVNGS